MTVIEKKILSNDKKHYLCGKIFVPDGEIKAAVQVVHGMTEHIDRYEPLMTLLAENGFLTFGHNHLGHKGTADDSELGFIAAKGGDELLVKDVISFSDAVCAEYGINKRFLFGHSMGSFVVRLAAEKMKDKLSALVVCGTGGPVPAAPAGLALCAFIKRAKGEKYISKTAYKIAFSEYSKGFGESDENCWLSADIKNREIYKKDKYCTFKFTVSALYDLVKLSYRANSNSWFENISKSLPIYLISGSEDPVGDHGKGVKAVYKKLKQKGANVAMKLYDGMRHEILNDIKKEETKKDILNFFNDNI